MTGNRWSTEEFVATDDGFGDVLARRMRRRRRRAAVAATSAGAAVVITVAVLSTLDLGTDSLRVVPTPATGPSGVPTPSASARPTAPAQTAATSAPSAQGTLAGSAPGAANTSPSATRPSTSARTSGESISTTMRRSTVAYDNTRPCADTSGRAATGWCVQVPGPFTAQHGRPASLAVALCRLPGTGGQAHFSGTLEADFALETTGQNARFLWHYDVQHPNRVDDHTYSVGAGSCLQWQTTWAVRADDGTDIPAGDYQLQVTVEADNVAAPGEAVARQDYAYTIT